MSIIRCWSDSVFLKTIGYGGSEFIVVKDKFFFFFINCFCYWRGGVYFVKGEFKLNFLRICCYDVIKEYRVKKMKDALQKLHTKDCLHNLSLSRWVWLPLFCKVEIILVVHQVEQ